MLAWFKHKTATFSAISVNFRDSRIMTHAVSFSIKIKMTCLAENHLKKWKPMNQRVSWLLIQKQPSAKDLHAMNTNFRTIKYYFCRSLFARYERKQIVTRFALFKTQPIFLFSFYPFQLFYSFQETSQNRMIICGISFCTRSIMRFFRYWCNVNAPWEIKKN